MHRVTTSFVALAAISFAACVFAASAASAAPASAPHGDQSSPWTLNIQLLSWHPTVGGRNPYTTGLGLSHSFGAHWRAGIGAYRSSDNTAAKYITAEYVFVPRAPVSFGILFGGVWGYPAGRQPLVAGDIAFRVPRADRVRVHLILVPPGRVSASAIQLALSVRL
jgi:hypothetical protein